MTSSLSRLSFTFILALSCVSAFAAEHPEIRTARIRYERDLKYAQAHYRQQLKAAQQAYELQAMTAVDAMKQVLEIHKRKALQQGNLEKVKSLQLAIDQLKTQDVLSENKVEVTKEGMGEDQFENELPEKSNVTANNIFDIEITRGKKKRKKGQQEATEDTFQLQPGSEIDLDAVGRVKGQLTLLGSSYTYVFNRELVTEKTPEKLIGKMLVINAAENPQSVSFFVKKNLIVYAYVPMNGLVFKKQGWEAATGPLKTSGHVYKKSFVAGERLKLKKSRALLVIAIDG